MVPLPVPVPVPVPLRAVLAGVECVEVTGEPSFELGGGGALGPGSGVSGNGDKGIPMARGDRP